MKRTWSIPRNWSWTLAVNRPWTVVLTSVFLVVIAVTLLSRLQASPLLESMFSSSNPTVQAYLNMQRSLESKDEIIIVAHDDSNPSSSMESKRRLVSFASRLQEAIEASNSPLFSESTLRYSDAYAPDIARYYEKVVVPNALHYLSTEDIDTLLARLSPAEVKAQIERNERLIAAPGSAGVGRHLQRTGLLQTSCPARVVPI